MSNSRCATLATLFAIALHGCGGGHDYGPTGKITGKLTLEGKPLSAKTGVQFMEPLKGFLAFGETDAEGNFEIASWNGGQMPLGKYKVYITPPPGTPTEAANLNAEQRFDSPDQVEKGPKLEYPQKYADKNKSGLEYEVKAGENHFDINLEAAKKK